MMNDDEEYQNGKDDEQKEREEDQLKVVDHLISEDYGEEEDYVE